MAAAAKPRRSHDSRCNRRKIGEIPVGHRQVLHRLRRHGERSFTALGLNHRRFTGDGDGLVERAHFHRQVGNHDAITGRHWNVPPLHRLETVHRHPEQVGVAGDVRKCEVAVGVRRCFHGCSARGAHQSDRRTGNHRVLRILYGADHRSARHLRKYWRCGQQERNDETGRPVASPSVHASSSKFCRRVDPVIDC